MQDDKGFVLVWDLDDTISYLDMSNNVILNARALALLKLASEGRTTGKVSAIFLLTNNSSNEYIQYIITETEKIVDTPKLFDYVMSCRHPLRLQNGNPSKGMEDVKNMMELLGKSIVNLAERTYFFDDRPDHLFRTQLPEGHYIQITPPFTGKGDDVTDFSQIEHALVFSGGKRKGAKTRRTRSKKSRAHKKQ